MKRERGKKDSISFKKKKKWEECGKLCKRLDECEGAMQDLMPKSGERI